jgi:hypothetical protein
MDTFVVRVWMPADEVETSSRGSIKGIVEHVADGSLMIFDAPEQLVEFLKENSAA